MSLAGGCSGRNGRNERRIFEVVASTSEKWSGGSGTEVPCYYETYKVGRSMVKGGLRPS